MLRIRWLLGRPERRRPAIKHWMRDGGNYLLITAVDEALKVLPIEACSGLGAFMAKNASRRYAELDARARENLKQIRTFSTNCCKKATLIKLFWYCRSGQRDRCKR